MAPFPVKELDYAEDLAKQYEEAQGPFVVRAAGQPDLYVVSELDLEWGQHLSEEAKKSLKQGFAEARRGEGKEAHAFLREVRAQYGV